MNKTSIVIALTALLVLSAIPAAIADQTRQQKAEEDYKARITKNTLPSGYTTKSAEAARANPARQRGVIPKLYRPTSPEERQQLLSEARKKPEITPAKPSQQPRQSTKPQTATSYRTPKQAAAPANHARVGLKSHR